MNIYVYLFNLFYITLSSVEAVGGALLRELCRRAAVQHERGESARAPLAAFLTSRVRRRQLFADCL